MQPEILTNNSSQYEDLPFDMHMKILDTFSEFYKSGKGLTSRDLSRFLS